MKILLSLLLSLWLRVFPITMVWGNLWSKYAVFGKGR